MTEQAMLLSDEQRQQRLLGQRLREIRLQHRFSINDVAEQVGISSSFLSLVETGKSDISFGRLMRITEFYGVALGQLFPGSASADLTVLRRADAVTVPSFAEGIQMALLAADDLASMTSFIAVYEESAQMSEPTLHDGEAFAYVIEGEISVQLVTSPEPTVLRAGDSVYLNTTEHRTYRNVGPGRAILLGVLLRDKNAVAPGVS